MARDSCTNLPELVMVVAFEMLDAVGCAITEPPYRSFPNMLSMWSAKEPALCNRRGTAINRSTEDGRNEVALLREDESCSIVPKW